MTMWRPKNWDEIVGRQYPYASEDLEEARQINDFESGADAMLEALEPLIRRVAPYSRLIAILYPKVVK